MSRYRNALEDLSKHDVAMTYRGGRIHFHRRLRFTDLLGSFAAGAIVTVVALGIAYNSAWDKAVALGFTRGMVATLAVQKAAGAAPYSMSFVPENGTVNLQIVPRFKARFEEIWVATDDNPDIRKVDEEMQDVERAYAMRAMQAAYAAQARLEP